VLSQVGFESLGKFTPRQQDPPPAASAFQSDIRAKPRDSPLIGTTRMLFSEAEMIVEMQVR
jgi:hypothetical protein